MTTKECETCGGEGVLCRDDSDARGEHETTEEMCEACGGTGVPRLRIPTAEELDAELAQHAGAGQ